MTFRGFGICACRIGPRCTLANRVTPLSRSTSWLTLTCALSEYIGSFPGRQEREDDGALRPVHQDVAVRSTVFATTMELEQSRHRKDGFVYPPRFVHDVRRGVSQVEQNDIWCEDCKRREVCGVLCAPGVPSQGCGVFLWTSQETLRVLQAPSLFKDVKRGFSSFVR